MKDQEGEEEKLLNAIIEGLEEKKAHNIVSINLKKMQSAISDYFIICHGTSDTQVEALANSVIDHVKKTTGERPFSKEGLNNAEWVLVDYVNVIVHIFRHDKRDFYNIEELWADAPILEITENQNRLHGQG